MKRDSSVWVYVRICALAEKEDAIVGCPVFRKTDRYTFFRLDDPEAKVLVKSRAHVLQHPIKKERKQEVLWCLNTWLARKHSACDVPATEGFFGFKYGKQSYHTSKVNTGVQ